MAQLDNLDWTLKVVRATAGSLAEGCQVEGHLYEETRRLIYRVDMSAPEEVWLEALSRAMTESARGFVYLGSMAPWQIDTAGRLQG